MQPIPTRFLKEIGTVHRLRRYWNDDHPCNGWSYHNAMKELGRTYVLDDHTSFGSEHDYAPEDYPSICHYCGHVAPAEGGEVHVYCQVFRRRLYVDSQGNEIAQDEMKPGDLFYIREHVPAPNGVFHHCPSDWVNCDGRHLHCILPNNTPWDIDGRYSNCTLPNDNLHRCWVRHGDPERMFPTGPQGTLRNGVLHVDKNGLTCQAGAGSISVPGWHGYLHHGKLTNCG